MICNLSAPQGNSVNDFIDHSLCSVHYTSFDSTISMFQKLGPGALLGKKDISSAFRLLPIRPENFSLLGFYFGNNNYIDKCLLFGCSIACATFEKFSTALHWIVENQSKHNTSVHHLYDICSLTQLILIYVKLLWNHLMQFVKNLGSRCQRKKQKAPLHTLHFLV